MSDYHPLRPEVIEDPYPFYAALRREAPVYPIPGLGLWAVSRYDDVMRVLRQPELFSSSPMRAALQRPDSLLPEAERGGSVGQTLIGSDPPLHTRLRKIANRGFTPARVAALEPRVRQIARALVDDFAAKGECDLVADYAMPLPVRVIAEMLGVDPERLDDFKRWSDAMVRAAFDPIPPEDRSHVQDCFRQMVAYFDLVIEARRRVPRDDVISALLAEEDDAGALTSNEIGSLLGTLLVAGNVTTTNLIGNAMLALLRNRGELERVENDPARVPGLVEEGLRFDTPAQLLPRAVTRDVEIAGTKVPEGTALAVLFGSANRDERAFADAHRFDLARDFSTRGHVAFGFGAHFCLGAPLARLEARVAFETLFARIRRPELAQERVPRNPSLILRGPASLRLTFDRTGFAGAA